VSAPTDMLKWTTPRHTKPITNTLTKSTAKPRKQLADVVLEISSASSDDSSSAHENDNSGTDIEILDTIHNGPLSPLKRGISHENDNSDTDIEILDTIQDGPLSPLKRGMTQLTGRQLSIESYPESIALTVAQSTSYNLPSKSKCTRPDGISELTELAKSNLAAAALQSPDQRAPVKRQRTKRQRTENLSPVHTVTPGSPILLRQILAYPSLST
jgi:hypothetical protein